MPGSSEDNFKNPNPMQNIFESQPVDGGLTVNIAEHKGAILRYTRPEDMPQVDRITAICDKAIHESWVALQGEDVYNMLRDPTVPWEKRKAAQNREVFAENPEWVWVLENAEGIFGFVTFKINAERSLGTIDNNGVLPEYAGKGYAAAAEN